MSANASAKVQEMKERASEYLNLIAGLFKEGAKLTLIVRAIPGNPETDVVLTSEDDLGEAVKAIHRRQLPQEGR